MPPLYTYAELCRGTRAASPERQGVGASGGAVTRRFTRPSYDYVQPAGSPLYTAVPPGIEAMAAGGIPCHNQLTCYQPYNAFVTGATGWTLTAGSGTAAMDTSIYMFDSTVQATPQSLKLTGGNPNTTPPLAVATASLDTAALATIRLRTWVQNDSGGSSDLQWALYSSRAAKYWNGSAFNSATAVWADVGSTTGDTTAFFLHEVAIDKGVTVSPDYLTMRFRQNGVGATSHIGYASLDSVYADVSGNPLSWRIPSGPPFPQDALSAAVTRANPAIRLHSESGMLAADAGTIFMTLVSDSSASCIYQGAVITFGTFDTALTPYLRIDYTPSGTIWVFFDTGHGLGVQYFSASVPWTGTTKFGIVYCGSARYLSSPGALRFGLVANGIPCALVGTSTLDVELFSGAPCKDAWIGNYPANYAPLDSFSGFIRDLAFSPEVWTPAQMIARTQ